jgi:hypothetical protein
MVQPMNYTLPQADPFAGVLQGLRLGATIQDMDAARAQQAMQVATQQQAMDRQRQLGQAMQGLMAKQNPTFADYQAVAVLAPKDQSEALLKSWGERSKEQQGNDLRFGAQVLSAFQVGSPDVGVSLLEQRAQAERNDGREDQAKAYETWAQLAKIDPKSAQSTIGVMLAGLPGGDKVVESVGRVQTQQREAALFGPSLTQARANAEKATADAVKAGVDAQFAPALAQAGLTKAQSDSIKAASDAKFADDLNRAGLNEKNWNVRAAQNRINVESARLGLDREKTTAEVALTLARIGDLQNSIPDAAKKDINAAAVAAGTAKQQAAQLNSLADRLSKESESSRFGVGWGAAGSAAEWVAKATGNQDYLSQLRQEFTRLRNSAAVQSLPPGPATDRDIALVLEGFPSTTADSRTITSFLRGMAKLQDINSATENARVDWLSNNRGSLARARSEFQAGEFTANPGETFVDLTARIAQDVSNRYAAGAGGPPTQPAAAIPGAPVRPGQVTPAGPRVGTPASLGGALPGVPPATTDIRSQADLIIRGGR